MAYVLRILVSLCLCLCLHCVRAQSGWSPQYREERRYGSQFAQNAFQSPRRLLSRLTGTLHLQPEHPYYDPQYTQPFQAGADSYRYSEQQSYSPNYQPPHPTGRGNPYEQYNRGRVSFPDNRPQWSQGQDQTGNQGGDFVAVEAPQSPRGEGSDAGISLGDRYSEATTSASEVAGERRPDGGLQVAPSTLPPLTPVPDAAARNNFNFGTQGLFKEECESPDGAVGTCVSLLQCEQFVTQLKAARVRANPALVLMLRRAHCGFDGETPKVCCPRRGIPTGAPPAPPPTPEPAPTEPATAASAKTAAPETSSTAAPAPDDDQFVAELPEPPVCGSSNATFSRVVGGIPAKLGDFPWMALLGYRNERLRDKVSFLCGGAIITEKHVLTAAHCYHTERNKLTLVRVGELDLARTDDGATPVDISIRRVLEHEHYDANAYANDIAVLLLEQLIPFTDLIKPICLPRSVELRSLTFEKYTPLIAGWGELQWHGEQSNQLQVVQLPVTSNEYCKKAFAAYKAQQIDGRVLCAGYEKGTKDACRGDSGGPLMQPIWNSVNYTTYFYQIGVVSFGKKCAEPGFPGVYTRVTAFMPWIEKTVLGHST